MDHSPTEEDNVDALQLLQADHDRVRDLFEQFKSAHEEDDTARMKKVSDEVFTELEIHTAIEEEVLYPSVRDAGGGDLDELTDESKEEHHVVDVLMGEIRALKASEDAFAAKMTVLMENVEHHASEEEDEMFPQIRELFSESALEELGARLEAAKAKHQLEHVNKSELYDEAADLDVEGRSTMNKEELQAAVDEARG